MGLIHPYFYESHNYYVELIKQDTKNDNSEETTIQIIMILLYDLLLDKNSRLDRVGYSLYWYFCR